MIYHLARSSTKTFIVVGICLEDIIALLNFCVGRGLLSDDSGCAGIKLCKELKIIILKGWV
jgi:hypothetical protein